MPEMTEYAPGTPSWVDLGTSDLNAAAAFYRALFGWEWQPVQAPGDTGGYGMFFLNGKQVAGGGPLMSADQPTVWGTYISVADADATAKAVQEHGGQVVFGPMSVFDTGRMAGCIDPTGAYFSIWQPLAHKGAQLVNEHNTWGWSELATRDMEKAKAFYTAVFPWTAKTDDHGGVTYTEWQLNGRSVAGGLQMGDSFPADVPPHWLTYFAVADIDATLATVRERGGQVAFGPMESPEGRFAVVQDPQGAVFAVIQTPR